MHPGEIKVEQVAKESMAIADVGPRDVSHHIITKSIQAILPLTLCFEGPDYINQLAVCCCFSPQATKIRILTNEPVGNGLMRLASAQLPNYLSVMAITSDSLQYYTLPITLLTQISIYRVNFERRLLYCFVSVLKVRIIPSKDFNLSDQVIFMCFGVRLVDTF